MSAPKWTPPPWEVGHFVQEDGSHEPHESGLYEVTEANEDIAALTGDGLHGEAWEMAEANRRLIGAAPTLYAALQADADWWAFEDAGCQDYPEGTDRWSPGGETIWRAWYAKCLAMCDRAQTLKAAALDLAREAKGTR